MEQGISQKQSKQSIVTMLKYIVDSMAGLEEEVSDMVAIWEASVLVSSENTSEMTE